MTFVPSFPCLHEANTCGWALGLTCWSALSPLLCNVCFRALNVKSLELAKEIEVPADEPEEAEEADTADEPEADEEDSEL